MKINIIYSFPQEIKEVFNVLINYKEYRELRSVVWPTPVIILSFLLKNNQAKKHIGKIWSRVSIEVEKALEKNNLKTPKIINCYVHSFSCEGWFDVDKDSIHIRYTKFDIEKELLNTIVHEILHLATYNKKMDYLERENLVDKYLSKPEFKKIV